jgi:NAD(P)-dependent dehydrogenase (short-subunit alcohol dehydrogenase family)
VTALGNVAAEVERLAQDAPDLDVCLADVRDADAIDAVVGKVLDRHSRIDALINAAAIMTRGTILDVDRDSWQRTFDVNVTGTYLLTRRVLPTMIAQGGGAIVNFGSPSGNGGTDHIAYCASKGAILAMTASLALDHIGDHVRINAVVPGSTRTGMNRDRPEDLHRLIGRSNVSGRVNEPDDVAKAVTFLVSDDAATISGAVLDVGTVTGQAVTLKLDQASSKSTR